MSQFIIDPKNISFDQEVADIRSYINSKPDAASWKDFFDASAGQIIIELLAGHSNFLAYQTILARREAFLRYAQNRSSIIGIAQNRGYSVFRGRNARIRLSITPTVSRTLNKFEIIGSALDVDLVVLDTVYLIAGTPTSIDCTIGNVLTETKMAVSDSPYVFRFEQPKVSNDLVIKLNDQTVEVSEMLTDAGKGKFVIQSNPIESVDVFYLNKPEFTVKYNTGDTLLLTYIELFSSTLTPTDIQVDLNGVSNTIILDTYTEPEDKETIRINAPIFNDTQFVIKAREDYHKILKLINTSIIETGFSDVSPMVIKLFYIRKDRSLFTPTEEASLLTQLLTYRSMGIEPPTFGETTRNNLILDIAIKIKTSDPSIISQLNTILEPISNKFGHQLDFEQIENDIESLPSVKIARVSIGSNSWAPSSSYEIGSFVNTGSSDIVHRAERLIYSSGSTEPVWPQVVGQTISDGRIIWTCFNSTVTQPASIWQTAKDYRLNDFVRPTHLSNFIYQATGTINRSGSNEPTWTDLGDLSLDETKGKTIYDNDLVWSLMPLEGSPPLWNGNLPYKKGDIVKPRNLTGTSDIMFQCVGYSGKSGSLSPTFASSRDGITNDGRIIWRAFDKRISPYKLAKNEFYILTNRTTLTT